MRITPVLFAVIGLLMASPTMSKGLSFRGLTASSFRSDVLKTFPNAEASRSIICDRNQKTTRSADGETLCDEVEIREYVLDNTPFSVTFGFNPDGTLRYISLIKQFGRLQKGAAVIDAGTVKSTFTSLADLISSKYGPAVVDSPSFLLYGSHSREFEWQPGRGTKWQNGGDRIKLKADGYPSLESPQIHYGSIQIFYEFAKRGEFDKF